MNEELLMRGVAAVYPSKEALETALKGERKLRIYLGIDPTGPTLHLGHAAVLLKLRDWQKLDHQIVILFGDFTARIGDPTDKKAVRRSLTSAEIETNLGSYRDQIGKILDLGKTEFRRNSEWFEKMNLGEFLPLAAELTHGQTIERDMFQERLKTGAPIYLHEFLYPLLQGYDSVKLEADLEIGASDQTFNMLVGRTLLRNRHREKFVLATKLLTDATGAKMGKTTGNMAALNESPAEIYGKVMSWPDELTAAGLELLTRLSEAEMKNILLGHPKEAKMRLAREVVSLVHDQNSARGAEENFVNTFQKKEEPSEWEEIKGAAGEKISEILMRGGAVKSKSEFTRLVDEGAVTIWPEKSLADYGETLAAEIKLKIGKKRFVRITLG